jgi:hypothetical protein
MPASHVESFRTHANYVRAFAMLCETPYHKSTMLPFGHQLATTLAHLAPNIVAAPSMSAPATAKPDMTQAHGSLTHAWGTELLLAFGRTIASDEPLIRLMNNWAVVQTYYTAYHAVQALIVARGHPRPHSHPKTQAQFAALWADRPLELPPWSLAACDGGWRNEVAHGIDDTLSSWSSCDSHSCWNLAAKALRTTRDEKVTEGLRAARDRARTANKRAWNEEERKRVAAGRKPRKEPSFPRPHLAAADKRRVETSIRSSTILDYLFRLRVKTNYEDAGMFIDGPEDEIASRRVHGDLVTIASCTMLAHELHVGAVVGKTSLISWVDDWIARHGAGANIGLGLRRDLLEAHLS